MLRIGLVGPGSIADHRLAPAITRLRGAALWSVCSRDRARAAAFAARHGAGGPVHDDLEAMLADPALDAVVIATPDRLHAPQALAALAAGKHVFVEKPLATSVADAEAVRAAAVARDRKLAVGYHLRWHAGLRALRERVRAGDLGRVLHLRLAWTFVERDADNWRAGPDVARWWSLAAVGTHALDLTDWLLRPVCGELTDLRALTSSFVHGHPHDETAVLALRFADGATADILTSVLFRVPRNLEIVGTRGRALAEEVLGPHGRGRITLTIDGAARELTYEPVDPYEAELQDFVDAVADDRAPAVDATVGVTNIQWLCEVT
ncbi:MAG: Gfo/Idh/MocA family oxidoreductase [Myxococcales bacterium]|nr:Gfo/Idh/MocA family oxidoreductase [Myxococcales bacterium]